MSAQAATGYAEVNGTRLYYEAAGAGQPMVLVHGFGLDCRMWDNQFTAFAPRWHVARYDLRGFGRSAPPVVGEAYRHIDDLAALLDHLGLDQAVLVGLSLGGLITLNTTLAYPERVSALVLVDAIAGGRPMSAAWNDDYRAVRGLARSHSIAAAKQAWLNLGLFAPARAHPQAGPLLRQMTEDWSGWQFANRDPENTLTPAIDQLGQVRAPALVLVGERDQPDFLAIANELKAGLPLARQVVVPGAGHLLPMEAPNEFNSLVEDFLPDA